ncbi:hypothetical protein [Rothia sp. 11254D007CT]
MKESTENIIAAQIGSARLSTYLTQAQGDRSRALALYLWNLESSAAVLSTTAMVEVHLRNTVDLALKSWNAAQDYTAEPGREGPYSQEWIEDPAPRIRNIVAPARRVSLKDKSRSSMKDINNKNTKPYPTHDDYVAGLTFGTWTSLLPHPDAGSNNIRVAIWETELSKYFSKHRNVVYYWAQHLRYARNRASHLEPLLDVRELQHYHRCAVRLLNALNPVAASWLAGQAFIPRALSKRP